MDKFLNQLDAFIRQHHLIPDGARLLLGVSGGLDSMVLLHALAQLAPAHQWRLEIAHLNHQLRARASHADQRLVAQTAQKLHLSCHLAQADIRALAKQQKISLEMAGRQARHRFFAQTARKRKIHLLALAHHADDQLELFLLRLLRGAGPEGLAAMQHTSPFPSSEFRISNSQLSTPHSAPCTLKILRPLLHFTKQDLRAYARAHRIPFRQDATNQSLDIQRNRIRHQLIPLLRKHYQPALNPIIQRLIQILRAENDHLAQLAHTWLYPKGRRPKAKGQKLSPLPFGLSPFHSLSPALQRRVLQIQLHSLLPNVQLRTSKFELIEHLRTQPNTPITLAPHTTLHRDPAGKIHLTHFELRTSNFEPPIPLTISITHQPSTIHYSGLTLTWRITQVAAASPRSLPKSKLPPVEHFDADTIGPTITLRHWQPGDRYQPIGMKAPIKLQDHFTNLKIPRQERRRLLLALDATGRIFWVQGSRISEHHKLTPATRNLLRWSWKPLPKNPERP